MPNYFAKWINSQKELITTRVNTHKNVTLRGRAVIQPIKLLDSLISTEYRQFERQQLQRVRINCSNTVELHLFHLGVRLVSLLSNSNWESDFSSRVFSSLSQATTSVTKKYILPIGLQDVLKKPQSREWRRKNTKGHDFQGEKVSERVRDGRNNKIRHFFSDQKAVKAIEMLSGGVVLF